MKFVTIRIEKVDIHEGITVKALLDSGVMGMSMDRKTAEKHSFKMRKLERPLVIRNIDRIENSGENIIH